MGYDDLLKETAINDVKDFTDSNLPTVPTVNGYKSVLSQKYTVTNVISEKK